MTGSKTEAKLAALQSFMAAKSVDLVALGPGAHMQYLLGFHPHADERPCLLLIGRRSACMLMPALNAEEAQAQTSLPFHVWADDDGPNKALAEALRGIQAHAAKHVSLDETMRADFALMLLDVLPAATHSFSQESVGTLRIQKDAYEFDILKRNALINDRAFLAGVEVIAVGKTESEIADVIKRHHSSEGARTEFCIVAAGHHGARPHHATGDTPINKGDAIVIDIGGRKEGFPSDMTRMVIVGSPPDGYEEVHAVVENAVCAAMDAARPGVLARTVDKAARDVIERAGYGEFFVHRTGHGLGIETHEPPYITASSDTVLDEGMVFSIEPGIYLPDRFGIRLEDIVILRAGGPEILSEMPRDAFVVE